MFAGNATEAATVLVTGSNRGIGFEFVRQYAERGWTVIATARDPSKAKELNELAAMHKNVAVEKLDIVNEVGIAAITRKYQGKPIDVLINIAAIVGDVKTQTLGGVIYRGCVSGSATGERISANSISPDRGIGAGHSVRAIYSLRSVLTYVTRFAKWRPAFLNIRIAPHLNRFNRRFMFVHRLGTRSKDWRVARYCLPPARGGEISSTHAQIGNEE